MPPDASPRHFESAEDTSSAAARAAAGALAAFQYDVLPDNVFAEPATVKPSAERSSTSPAAAKTEGTGTAVAPKYDVLPENVFAEPKTEGKETAPASKPVDKAATPKPEDASHPVFKLGRTLFGKRPDVAQKKDAPAAAIPLPSDPERDAFYHQEYAKFEASLEAKYGKSKAATGSETSSKPRTTEELEAEVASVRSQIAEWHKAEYKPPHLVDLDKEVGLLDPSFPARKLLKSLFDKIYIGGPEGDTVYAVTKGKTPEERTYNLSLGTPDPKKPANQPDPEMVKLELGEVIKFRLKTDPVSGKPGKIILEALDGETTGIVASKPNATGLDSKTRVPRSLGELKDFIAHIPEKVEKLSDYISRVPGNLDRLEISQVTRDGKRQYDAVANLSGPVNSPIPLVPVNDLISVEEKVTDLGTLAYGVIRNSVDLIVSTVTPSNKIASSDRAPTAIAESDRVTPNKKL